MSDPGVVTRTEAVMLLHPFLSRVASDRGCRALVIKGPCLSAHGVREYRDSGDVDILCDPSHGETLIRELTRLGWRRLTPAPAAVAGVVLGNATTLVHPRWPCNIDLHHYFPGFLAPDEQVFEALWDERGSVLLAHQPVTTTGLLGTILVQALHLQRSEGLTLTPQDVHDLQDVVRQLPEPQKDSLVDLAIITGCGSIVGPVLPVKEIGSPSAQPDPDRLALWNLRVRNHPGSAWRMALRNARWRRRPQVLLAALTFDRDRALRGEARPYTYRLSHVVGRIGLAARSTRRGRN